jgi:hypothetical protein
MRTVSSGTIVCTDLISLYHTDKGAVKLPGDFAVWAASEEAEFLHGRFVWAKWDVDELKTGPLRKKIESDASLFRVGVNGY